jgi:uncharacterized protein YdhG (YjbR/CyaY superfamily)
MQLITNTTAHFNVCLNFNDRASGVKKSKNKPSKSMAKITDTLPARNVDEYLAALPDSVMTTLEKLRTAIKAAAPMAEEVISYQVPTYKYKGSLVHFAAFKDHCSLVVVSKSIGEIFKKELSPYKISGRTIHFSPAKPLPATLVKKIIKVRIRENEENDAAAKAKRGKEKK